jgi:Flp pilus assembly protein TadB
MTVAGWNVETLATHIERQLEDMRSMLKERYDTQTKAVDAAFAAQQIATQTALTSAKDAVSIALEAADRAAVKAEQAADKRFEAITEKMQDIDTRMQTALSTMADRLNVASGRSSGLSQGWSYLVSVGALVTALYSIFGH